MSETKSRVEWAVRWPEGEIEECLTRAQAEGISRLHADAVVVHREVVPTPWVEA